jgi:hypothetical protein
VQTLHPTPTQKNKTPLSFKPLLQNNQHQQQQKQRQINPNDTPRTVAEELTPELYTSLIKLRQTTIFITQKNLTKQATPYPHTKPFK